MRTFLLFNHTGHALIIQSSCEGTIPRLQVIDERIFLSISQADNRVTCQNFCIIRISPTWKSMRTRAVPHSVPLSSAREPAGPASSGAFFLILVLDKQKKYARRRAKGNLMDNIMMIAAVRYSFTGRAKFLHFR